MTTPGRDMLAGGYWHVKLLSLVLVVVLSAARIASAQATTQVPCGSGGSPGGFTSAGPADRPWYAPLIANPRDAQSEVVVWGNSKRFPYMPKAGNHRIWDVSFGKELPIAVWETAAPGRAFVECGGWGFGLWAPLSFHMVDDLAEDSSPIINHDYRLAIAFKVAHGITPRDTVSAKIQFGHESTHLGDEFVIRAIDEYGEDFQRINVSYEYVEFGVNWDHLFGRNGQRLISLRASGVRAASLGGGRGWYSTELMDGTVIQPSRMNFEPAFGAEYMPQGTHGWRPFVSCEGRLRTVYDYARTLASQREARQWSSSVVVGLRNLAGAGRGMSDLIVKGYYGVNPHGQFRSQPNYWMFGFGMLVRL